MASKNCGDHLIEANREVAQKPKLDNPEKLVKNQINFQIRGIVEAVSRLLTFGNGKVLFSILLKVAMCSSLLKMNF